MYSAVELDEHQKIAKERTLHYTKYLPPLEFKV